ncbi:hypothetical protein [Streptomyces rishiriensis]|uniref:Uncharacterized protein n=1 Tax=Streptomyces rishiriensis TaxID=68264 RepID=A0ABU0P295_STRRH|nr:hypothetical protein [Streptomyces rishiriensis]MDQ0585489.1 hypothetical protein [Streptomyces rishiriensis]
MQHAQAFGAVQQRHPPAMGAVRAVGAGHDVPVLVGPAGNGALYRQLRRALRRTLGGVKTLAGQQPQDITLQVAEVDEEIICDAPVIGPWPVLSRENARDR